MVLNVGTHVYQTASHVRTIRPVLHVTLAGMDQHVKHVPPTVCRAQIPTGVLPAKQGGLADPVNMVADSVVEMENVVKTMVFVKADPVKLDFIIRSVHRSALKTVEEINHVNLVPENVVYVLMVNMAELATSIVPMDVPHAVVTQSVQPVKLDCMVTNVNLTAVDVVVLVHVALMMAYVTLSRVMQDIMAQNATKHVRLDVVGIILVTLMVIAPLDVISDFLEQNAICHVQQSVEGINHVTEMVPVCMGVNLDSLVQHAAKIVRQTVVVMDPAMQIYNVYTDVMSALLDSLATKTVLHHVEWMDPAI